MPTHIFVSNCSGILIEKPFLKLQVDQAIYLSKNTGQLQFILSVNQLHNRVILMQGGISMVPVFPLLLVTILLCPLSPEAQKYYVTPTPPPNPDCPLDQPCHTLSYYASNASSLFNDRENVSLLFLDGVHNLDISLVISQVQSLTIEGVNGLFNNGTPRASIQFNQAFPLQLKLLEVKNIKLLQAILSLFNVEWFISQNTFYEDSAVYILSATAKRVHITGSNYLRSYLAFNFPGNNFTTVHIANTACLDAAYYACFGLLTSTDVHVLITNSIFENNVLGVVIRVNGERNVQLKLEVMDSQFIKNQAACYSQHSGGNHSVLFRNVSVIDNQAKTTTGESVAIFGPATVTMENCLFNNNMAGLVLRLQFVELYFIGNTTFSNNIGNSGGAILMINTTIWLSNGTHISFINNSVSEVGGAIWVTPYDPLPPFYSSITAYPPCFYQLTFDLAEPLDNQTLPVSVTFSGNKARTGGHDIYGAALQSNCKMTPNRQISSYMVQDKIFQFDTRTLSSISSSPKRVCLCKNGVPVCVTDISVYNTFSNLFGNQTKFLYNYHNISATPGEKFNLTVALVGNDFGLVTGGVYALDRTEEDASFLFSPGEKLQQITDLRCTDIEYAVHPVSENITTVELLLATDSISASIQLVMFQPSLAVDYPMSIRKYLNENEITAQFLTAPVFVRITILPCPLGLILTQEKFDPCQCKPELNEFVESCAIINKIGVLYRNGTNWIGTSPYNNSTIIANKFCPFGYCKSEKLGISLDNPDIQCALNHSGVLCGGCPPGLSLAIGSSKCIDCPDNNGVALLVVFIVAGVALVLFIKLLDITVAHGTINGLILYANIIWINQGIFLPVFSEKLDQNLSNLYYFLRLFVSWLSLDFGIETCFIEGLDAYGKTWLQFLFPIYLWLIALFIVVLCHYSTKATKYFGHNAVAVLTTLLMLSHTKLQRTIVLSLGVTQLDQFNPNDTQLVWTLDGNIKYFCSFHAFLFFVALAAAVFLCIPFILGLLFVGHLHRLPCASIARRINKAKPLLDTFTGPLKAKRQYWVGLTFLVRVILVVLTGIFETFNPTINIDLVIILSALLCPVVIEVYKKRYLCLLELAFLINLVILGVAFLSTDELESRVVCTCISVAISFLIFVGIVVYHLYLIISKRYKAQKVLEPENTIQQQPITTFTTSDVDIDDFHTTSMLELREDLLESNYKKLT